MQTYVNKGMDDDAPATKATCIRQVTNWSYLKPHHRFESDQFDPMALRKEIAQTSPKMKALFERMDALDRTDQKMEGRVFKHVIFSDLTHGYGAKIIASSCIAMGFRLVYDASLKWVPPEDQVPYYNFALLASGQIFNNAFPTALRRKIVETFNRRPENVYGEQLRVILLDSGYKEGLDLFDVKYIHLFEPTVSAAEETQIIGRGTRYCGQKGLTFHPTLGWPIHVYRYELAIPPALRPVLGGETSLFPVYLKYAHIDFRKILFATALERATIQSAVDYPLNKAVHRFGISESEKDIEYLKSLVRTFIYNLDPRSYANLQRPTTVRVPVAPAREAVITPTAAMEGGKRVAKKKPKRVTEKALQPVVPTAYLTHSEMVAFVNANYRAYRWTDIQMENKCVVEAAPPSQGDRKPTIVEFTPTQNFMRSYLQPASVYKGVLAWHSVGTGKTCMAIAAASSGFEAAGYTILWVTRHTLKPDIWKNMYDQVCSIPLQKKLKDGTFEGSSETLGKGWESPISYRQFTNLLNRKNELYAKMVKRNGVTDPLRKTLVIIDEAHKLYTTDIPAQERPDVEKLKAMVHASYETSGKDSVRLLLMSATPYTTEPMNLVRLLNLLMPADKNLPETFDGFAAAYLDDTGDFTPTGRVEYQNAVTGYISYLNREKDARQFAYPVIEDIVVPMSENQAKTIRGRIRSLEKEITDLKKRSEEQQGTRSAVRRRIKDDREGYMANVCARQPAALEQCKAFAAQKSDVLSKELMSEIETGLQTITASLKNKTSQLEYLKQQSKILKDTDISQERALLERCEFKPKTPSTRRAQPSATELSQPPASAYQPSQEAVSTPEAALAREAALAPEAASTETVVGSERDGETLEAEGERRGGKKVKQKRR